MTKRKSKAEFAGYNALKQLGIIFARIEREFKEIFKNRRSGKISRKQKNTPEYYKLKILLEEIDVEIAAFRTWLRELARKTSRTTVAKVETALKPLLRLKVEDLEYDFEKYRDALIK